VKLFLTRLNFSRKNYFTAWTIFPNTGIIRTDPSEIYAIINPNTSEAFEAFLPEMARRMAALHNA
jgi:hypothetical protein